MCNLLILAVVSFFSAFGMIQFIRFLYSHRQCCDTACYVLTPVKNRQEDIECVIRELMLETESTCVIAVDMDSDDSTFDILRRLEKRYANLRVFTRDQYIEFLNGL